MVPLPRALALALCLLGVALCATAVSPVAVAVPGVDVPVPSSGTAVQSDAADRPQATSGLALPERTVLSGPADHRSTRVERDVAASLDSDSTEIDGAYERALLEEQLARAEGQRDRQAVLREWAGSLNQSLLSLEDRERAARQSFRRGGGSAQTLLSNLRAIDARARQIDGIAQLVLTRAEDDSASNVTDRVEALQGDIAIRQGTVRNMVGEIGAGERSPSRFYVSASANGTVLATISGDEYHREATRGDLLQARGTNGAPQSVIQDVITDRLYPVHNEHYGFSSGADRIVLFQLYRVLADSPELYPHGDLRAYVDGVSETVFFEYQKLSLDSDLPTRDTISSNDNGTAISVDRTYPTGPARVRVTHDGEPVDGATVHVDGTEVDTTQDGVGWVVLPHDVQTVSVEGDDASAETTVTW